MSAKILEDKTTKKMILKIEKERLVNFIEIVYLIWSYK